MVDDDMYFFQAEISWGKLLVLYGPDGLQALKILEDNHRKKDIEFFLEGRLEKTWPELLLNLKNYFNGIHQVDFAKFPVSLVGCSAYTVKVLGFIRNIPYGRVYSYSGVARKIGFSSAASRPLGKALGKNPLPVIIPCHRVVKKDGSAGGFSLGIDRKINLLELEGVKISNLKGRISDEIFICR